LIQAFAKYKNMLFKQSTLFHRIIFPMEMYLHIISPILFAVLFMVTIFSILRYPFVLILAVLLLIPQMRKIVIVYATNNLLMISALFNEIMGKKQIIWRKQSTTREFHS
ncbi:MAG: hypothetical protein ACFFDT_34750, partial [Candidatus Hodarchaeota archaeon]